MKISRGRRVTIIVVIVLLTASTLVATEAGAWQTGRVAAIEINGQGADTPANTRAIRNSLWWTYGICTGGLTYYAVSRMSPARLGLSIDCAVKFSATTSQITLRDSRGNQYVLRILRKIASKDCAGR